jgi:hypothetical protein
MSDGPNFVPAPDGYVQNELGQWVPDAAPAAEVDAAPVDEPASLSEAVHAADALAGE